MNLYYDLHIHSCLSPCGDQDMTPANIAGMAAIKGLEDVYKRQPRCFPHKSRQGASIAVSTCTPLRRSNV